MSASKPRVAVVGSGYWGRNLVRNFQALGSLTMICDREEAVLAGFREQYPEAETCLAYSEVLRRAEVDAVAIATPAETHYGLAREALLAGKHVYVEKPLVLEEGQGRELIELAEERERVLMVGHLLRYHPVFVHLQELAQSGALGRIDYVYSHRLNLGKIRREENILWSFAPHDISMILALAGELPARVLATGGCYLHQRIADVTTTHLEFESGLRAHVFVSWLHPFKEQKLVVVGERRMAVFDDTQPWADKLLLYPHQIQWPEQMPVPVRAEAERPDIAEAEPLRRECEHFIECVATGKRPLTDGAEGLRVLRVLRAAQAAMDGGGTPVFVGSSMAGAPERGAAGAMSPTAGLAATSGWAESPGREAATAAETSAMMSRDRAAGARAADAAGTPASTPAATGRDAGTVGAADSTTATPGQVQPAVANTAAPAPAAPSTPHASDVRYSDVRYMAHPTAVIDADVEIGAGTRIWHFSHVLSGSRIGSGCTVGQNVMIGPNVVIGDRCKIQNNVSVYQGVTLEDGVFCGPSMVFTNVFMPRAEVDKMDQARPTRVRRGATLGANCTVVCGVTIGQYAFVGAGAVVTRSVPDYALVLGNPSRHVGWVSRHGERLPLPVEGAGEAVCPATGERYRLSAEGVKRG